MPTRKGGESYLQKGGLVGKPIGPRNTFIAALQSYEETGPAFSGWKKQKKHARQKGRDTANRQRGYVSLMSQISIL